MMASESGMGSDHRVAEAVADLDDDGRPKRVGRLLIACTLSRVSSPPPPPPDQNYS